MSEFSKKMDEVKKKVEFVVKIEKLYANKIRCLFKTDEEFVKQMEGFEKKMDELNEFEKKMNELYEIYEKRGEFDKIDELVEQLDTSVKKLDELLQNMDLLQENGSMVDSGGSSALQAQIDSGCLAPQKFLAVSMPSALTTANWAWFGAAMMAVVVAFWVLQLWW